MAKGGGGQWRWLWITFAVVVLDLASKSMASYYLTMFSSKQLTPFLNLCLVDNSGSAFSFLADQNGWQLWLFVGIAIVVSIGILTYLWCASNIHTLTALALCLILGGAIGNTFNRIVSGYVVDFIDFHIKDWHFYTFNIADSAITLGVICLILSAFRKG